MANIFTFKVVLTLLNFINTVGCYILHCLMTINYLLCFFLAGISDRCGCSTGRAGGGGGVGSWGRRKRIRIINESLPPFSLLYHLNQAVGHEHDNDGG